MKSFKTPNNNSHLHISFQRNRHPSAENLLNLLNGSPKSMPCPSIYKEETQQENEETSGDNKSPLLLHKPTSNPYHIEVSKVEFKLNQPNEQFYEIMSTDNEENLVLTPPEIKKEKNLSYKLPLKYYSFNEQQVQLDNEITNIISQNGSFDLIEKKFFG